MNQQPLIIAIDFDGLIVQHAFPDIGPLRLGSVPCINAIKDAGHKIIIWTCRTSPESISAMVDFLRGVGIPFDAINSNVPPATNWNIHPKVYADYYIDDRAIGCPESWTEIHAELRRIGVL